MALLAAPRASERARPAPWNVEPGLVIPEYQHLWRDLVWGTALWSGNGRPMDVVTQKPASTMSNVEWKTAQRGVGLSYSSSASTWRAEWDEDFTIANEFTWDVFFRIDGDVVPSGNNQAMILSMGSWTAVPLQIFISPGGGDPIRAQRGDSSSMNIRSQTITPGEEVHVAVTVVANGNMTGFLDGVQTVQATYGGSVHDPASGPSIGQRADGEESLDGIVYTARMWNRVLSDGEIAQLGADPFGMFRPRWDTVTSAFDPANLQASVTTDDVTLTWTAS